MVGSTRRTAPWTSLALVVGVGLALTSACSASPDALDTDTASNPDALDADTTPDPDAWLANGPARDGRFFKVPKIIE